MRPKPALPDLCDRAQIIVLSNREPYSHEVLPEGQVELTYSTSGVVHAVEGERGF